MRRESRSATFASPFFTDSLNTSNWADSGPVLITFPTCIGLDILWDARVHCPWDYIALVRALLFHSRKQVKHVTIQWSWHFRGLLELRRTYIWNANGNDAVSRYQQSGTDWPVSPNLINAFSKFINALQTALIWQNLCLSRSIQTSRKRWVGEKKKGTKTR